MPHGTLGDILQTDIYLIDQILKGRYDEGGRILDAGCGGGRNLSWFVSQPVFDLYAIDMEEAAVQQLRQTYPGIPADHVAVAAVQQMPFADAFFDHIICQAVVHFARDKEEFLAMFAELLRVLKPGGSLFMRIASDIGLEEKMLPLGEGRFAMPDGTDRFLLNRALIAELIDCFGFALAEPVKTTNVNDIRCMTTLVLLAPEA